MDAASSSSCLRTAVTDVVARDSIALAAVWPAIERWCRRALDGVDEAEDVLGFECSAFGRGHDPATEPDRPPGAPTGPAMTLAVFRLLDGSEHGVEFWYAWDDDWLAATRTSDWDAHHPIGFHGWGTGGRGGQAFARWVETVTLFQLAVRKPCVLLRLFATHEDDLVSCAPPKS
jgi:hypothetical protein